MKMSRYYLHVVGSGTKFRRTAKPSILCTMRPPARQKLLLNLRKTGTSIGDLRSRLPMKTNNEVTLVIRDL